MLKTIKKHLNNFISDSIEETVRMARVGNNHEQVVKTASQVAKNIINERYSIASQIKPVKHSIDIISHLVNSVDVILKDNKDNVIDCPIANYFNNINASILHTSFNDFKISFQKEMLINGIVYLLAELTQEGSDIIRLEIVPTNYIAIGNAVAFNGIISTYLITNFLNLRSATFQLDTDNRYYTYKDKDRSFILFATEVGFEKGSMDSSYSNLCFSPLISIALEVENYKNAMLRLSQLNNSGISGGILDVIVPASDQENKTAIKEDLERDLKGVVNTGNVKILVRQAGVQQAAMQFTPIGNKVSDYNLANDIDYTEKSIYESFGISASYAKQEAKYLGNQAESLRQLYNGKIFYEVNRMYAYLQRWLYPFFDIDVNEYKYTIDTSVIDVFMQNKVTFIQSVGDILTVNEKRELLNYTPIKEMQSSNEDDLTKALDFFKTNAY